MADTRKKKNDPPERPGYEPRWPVILAMIAAVALPFALPRSLSVLPQWIVAVIVAVLLAAAIVTHYIHKPHLNQVFG
ncbi:MAG: hypothetical protein M3Y05_02150, partial [Gemmatimonadota bacterium]|nr:hypothetical protein [Gemmatimonadota bacterium]